MKPREFGIDKKLCANNFEYFEAYEDENNCQIKVIEKSAYDELNQRLKNIKEVFLILMTELQDTKAYSDMSNEILKELNE